MKSEKHWFLVLGVKLHVVKVELGFRSQRLQGLNSSLGQLTLWPRQVLPGCVTILQGYYHDEIKVVKCLVQGLAHKLLS